MSGIFDYVSTRRRFLKTSCASVALTALSSNFVIPAQAESASSAPPDLAKAREEGPLVVWHNDLEPDVVQFANSFTEATGIKVIQQAIQAGIVMAKLEAEFRTGRTSTDVYQTADPGAMEQLRMQNRLLHYVPADISFYKEAYRSAEPGFYTAYCVNIGPMMYDTRKVTEVETPKSWLDLLDPKWRGLIGFQHSATATSYVLWLVLQNVLPQNYFDRLAEQKPRPYGNSTAMVQDLERGTIKIGGRVSIFQLIKAAENGVPLKAVYPAEGTPASNQVIGAFVNTARPNAAKAYIDYMLSKTGQARWNAIQSSHSAREDVVTEGLPPIGSIKLLQPTDLVAYASPENRKKFTTVWNKVLGT